MVVGFGFHCAVFVFRITLQTVWMRCQIPRPLQDILVCLLFIIRVWFPDNAGLWVRHILTADMQTFEVAASLLACAVEEFPCQETLPHTDCHVILTREWTAVILLIKLLSHGSFGFKKKKKWAETK